MTFNNFTKLKIDHQSQNFVSQIDLNSPITSASLDGCRSKYIDVLIKFTNITKLKLKDVKINDKLKEITNLKNLNYLSINYVPQGKLYGYSEEERWGLHDRFNSSNRISEIISSFTTLKTLKLTVTFLNEIFEKDNLSSNKNLIKLKLHNYLSQSRAEDIYELSSKSWNNLVAYYPNLNNLQLHCVSVQFGDEGNLSSGVKTAKLIGVS